jgi:hypothetical protein
VKWSWVLGQGALDTGNFWREARGEEGLAVEGFLEWVTETMLNASQSAILTMMMRLCYAMKTPPSRTPPILYKITAI